MFSFKRIGLLLRKHWIENYRIYLMGGGVIAGFGFLVFLSTFYFQNGGIENSFQLGVFTSGLLLCGPIFASYVFNDFSQKPKGILFLTLPGSSLEKFLSLWLYATVGFLLLYSLIFYAIAIPFVQASHYYRPERADMISVLNLFSSDKKLYNLFYFYFPGQAIFLLGGIWFERFSFIKTAVSGLLAWALFMFINYMFVRMLFNEESLNEDNVFAVPFILVGHSYITAHLPETLSAIVEFIFKYCVTPFLWFVTYLKLKEKEL